MVDVHELKHGMKVVTADGRTLGTIDNASVDGIKLAKNSTADGQHHHVAADRIARVEGNTVHLNVSAAELPLGAATTTHAHTTGDKKSILPWILGALAAIILLALLLSQCDREPDATPVATETTAADVSAAPAAVPAAGTIASDVQSYLADANGVVPRTFTFEKLNFDTGSAAIRDADRADLDQLAGVLTSNPNVRVRIVGYTDAQGAAQPNAELGAQRAKAVAEALTAKGVAADRIETASGGESNPTDTNATAGGRFENRRTELIVLSR